MVVSSWEWSCWSARISWANRRVCWRSALCCWTSSWVWYVRYPNPPTNRATTNTTAVHHRVFTLSARSMAIHLAVSSRTGHASQLGRGHVLQISTPGTPRFECGDPGVKPGVVPLLVVPSKNEVDDPRVPVVPLVLPPLEVLPVPPLGARGGKVPTDARANEGRKGNGCGDDRGAGLNGSGRACENRDPHTYRSTPRLTGKPPRPTSFHPTIGRTCRRPRSPSPPSRSRTRRSPTPPASRWRTWP